MKYIVNLVWGFILGHVAFYIGSALEGNSYDFIGASILGIFISVIVFLIASLFPDSKVKHS
ncbi:YjzD family protein [Jeotgalibaca caeni]|uniref:YjzD family protein n=1 Tax=Jeotgalibaca caeni TaxID=3028623 RepID=UPI00237E7EAB|nr:YjzD family protein [Jeotgalibaca caeni]MDE1548971.1 YjzD family protein [Jeotgalibaca caeni]